MKKFILGIAIVIATSGFAGLSDKILNLGDGIFQIWSTPRSVSVFKNLPGLNGVGNTIITNIERYLVNSNYIYAVIQVPIDVNATVQTESVGKYLILNFINGELRGYHSLLDVPEVEKHFFVSELTPECRVSDYCYEKGDGDYSAVLKRSPNMEQMIILAFGLIAASIVIVKIQKKVK